MGLAWGLALGSILLGVACGGLPVNGQAGPIEALVSFSGTDRTLQVEIADSDDEQGRGLMGRTELPADRGMAFVYDDPVEHRYTMRDTLLPLSIAFVDQRGRIVTIREMVPCTGEPCEDYVSDAPYVLAVEANRGWFADHGIEEGQRVEMQRA